MATTLKFFSDAGLTTPLAGLSFMRAADGSFAADDRIIYLGSGTAGKTFAAADGTSNVLVSLVDSATGSGVPASAVSLATSAGGLDSATPGAAIDLGASVLGGSANAKEIHLRVLTGALAAAVYTDVSLTTNSLLES